MISIAKRGSIYIVTLVCLIVDLSLIGVGHPQGVFGAFSYYQQIVLFLNMVCLTVAASISRHPPKFPPPLPGSPPRLPFPKTLCCFFIAYVDQTVNTSAGCFFHSGSFFRFLGVEFMSMGVGQGPWTLKFYPGPPWSTLLRPAGRRPAAVLYPFGHPTPCAYGYVSDWPMPFMKSNPQNATPPSAPLRVSSLGQNILTIFDLSVAIIH
jgi:hypothetical protein